jgi:phage terminase large subunit-like protein
MKLTPHPVLHAPSEEEIKALVGKVGEAKTLEILQIREDKIEAEKSDPYRHGFEPWYWRDADRLLDGGDELLISGGNRAGKTEYAAKRVVYTLINKPNARVWCLHTTNQSSIQMQQSVVWKYLPSELKLAKKTKVTNIAYTQKNGFSENSFVLPNGSQCFFMNYAQDRTVIEGGETDLIWCDELVPLDWVETLRFRNITRRGKLIVTFTPISGYTPVVKDYIAGSRVQESKPAKLMEGMNTVIGCKSGEMPYISKCIRRGAFAIWFFSEFNPYNPFDHLAKGLKGRSSYEIKIRAYGWAESLQGTQFPRFGDANIIPANKIPAAGSNYMSCDPAGARNWFMLWMRVDENGNRYIYREWPDASVGEWALPSEKPDGKVGSAQTTNAGRGLDEYRELMRHLEGSEIITERYVDPRAGSTQAAGRDGGTSIIELFQQGDYPMFLMPAAGIAIEEGVGMINNWLSYDMSQPISSQNQPKLFVSEDCQNLIYCLKEWTGQDGQKGASKDPIDCLRYLAVMDPEFEDNKTYQASRPFSY